MTNLFTRAARVLIGKPGTTGLIVENLRVKFSIQKTSESAANSALINVYNLKPESRAFVENTGLNITLQVGYTGTGPEDGLIENIFTGDIFRAATEKQDQDIVTCFECLDGGLALKTATVNTSFSGGKTRAAVVDYLARELAMAHGLSYNKLSIADSSQFVNGITLVGPVKQHLDTIVPTLGLVWYIRDGEVIITSPKNMDLPGAVLVSKDTGMIGIPVKREQGLELTSLLNPRIRPGSTIQVVSVESAKLNGYYHVERANYEGDTLEGNWEVKVEAL